MNRSIEKRKQRHTTQEPLTSNRLVVGSECLIHWVVISDAAKGQITGWDYLVYCRMVSGLMLASFYLSGMQFTFTISLTLRKTESFLKFKAVSYSLLVSCKVHSRNQALLYAAIL
ncbi:hypothetical protein PoB_003935200 [Plakobranchus ocellatus]|uniref:Uncharacterized protein n=1 Tax=Plakobranchus ocellatus TaxID=259542 RepID=A0AAV4B001_9GAST|nr:hypothetical protein PoB_003935200 [Plakobranchus ocellatus]